jgi:hypothetical protein
MKGTALTPKLNQFLAVHMNPAAIAVIPPTDLEHIYSLPTEVKQVLTTARNVHTEYRNDGLTMFTWLRDQVYLSEGWTQLDQQQRGRHFCYMQNLQQLIATTRDADGWLDLMNHADTRIYFVV